MKILMFLAGLICVLGSTGYIFLIRHWVRNGFAKSPVGWVGILLVSSIALLFFIIGWGFIICSFKPNCI